MHKKDSLYTPSETAQLAYCTRHAIYMRVRRGLLQARRVGGRLYIRGEEVAKLIDIPVDQLPASERAA